MPDDLSVSPDDLSVPEAPTDRPRRELDARDLPPPEPLQRTLEALTDIEDGAVLLQYNDRAPRHLYPKLEDRGYDFETVDAGDCVVTAIWGRGG